MKKMKLSLRKPARPVQTDPKQVAERRQARRKALKTIAKVGLYTPPALLALLKNVRAKAASGEGPP